ncbi:hypothetical protein [Streptomyces sp. NPDC002215]|uniref:hypothetical protein n=1 Tax=Streptomyces sp. NPDC002215 TaxID=3154412 RepID=UPI0033325CB7
MAHHGVTVACAGAPGHPRARGLYYGVGSRELTRDAPLIESRTWTRTKVAG